MAERLTTERLEFFTLSLAGRELARAEGHVGAQGPLASSIAEENAMSRELLDLRARVAELERNQPMAPSGQPAATDWELAECAWSLAKAVERRLGQLEALFPTVEEPGAKGLGKIRMLSCREVAEMVCIEREVSRG